MKLESARDYHSAAKILTYISMVQHADVFIIGVEFPAATLVIQDP